MAKSGGSYPTPAKQSATPGTGAAAKNLESKDNDV